ncbi:hypothetical protein SLEP1_g51421 [Rubroshorea leprosula]|uniref:Uncharacterized protein n=1 Tax=Rubroshorea leprosula TaxID=152421 RepID=A0AAV5M3C6_9ROSI|nr:hypothetical protein SLEP1_g51421 [Rubroshorea leprosula]
MKKKILEISISTGNPRTTADLRGNCHPLLTPLISYHLTPVEPVEPVELVEPPVQRQLVPLYILLFSRLDGYL